MTSRPACPGRRGRRCVAAIRGDRVDARELIRRRDGDSILHTEHIAAPRRGRLSGRAVARRSRQSGPDRPDPRGGGLRRGQAAGARAAARGIRTLAAQLFVDPEVAERFVHIETAAQASGSFLRILLCIDPSAQELHGLHWELLCHPRIGAAGRPRRCCYRAHGLPRLAAGVPGYSLPQRNAQATPWPIDGLVSAVAGSVTEDAGERIISLRRSKPDYIMAIANEIEELKVRAADPNGDVST